MFGSGQNSGVPDSVRSLDPVRNSAPMNIDGLISDDDVVCTEEIQPEVVLAPTGAAPNCKRPLRDREASLFGTGLRVSTEVRYSA